MYMKNPDNSVHRGIVDGLSAAKCEENPLRFNKFLLAEKIAETASLSELYQLSVTLAKEEEALLGVLNQNDRAAFLDKKKDIFIRFQKQLRWIADQYRSGVKTVNGKGIMLDQEKLEAVIKGLPETGEGAIVEDYGLLEKVKHLLTTELHKIQTDIDGVDFDPTVF